MIPSCKCGHWFNTATSCPECGTVAPYREKKPITIYKEALRQFGKDSQLFMLFEELAELQDVVCKMHRSRIIEHDALCEELADVQIMLEQLKLMYGIDEGVVNQFYHHKLERLEGYIKSAKEAKR